MMTPPSALPKEGVVGFVPPEQSGTIIIPPEGAEPPSSPNPERSPASPISPDTFSSTIPPHTSGSDGVQASPPPNAPIPIGNPWPKRIIIIFIFLILVIGAFFGGRTLVDILAQNKEVTITYWGLWENDAIIRPIIDEFESKNPKIKVVYSKQSHRQYRERLSNAIERGEGPDVFRYHNTWLFMLAKDIAPVPATVMTPQEFASTFYAVAARDLVAGQTIYGIPLMIEGLGLYYNEDIFAAAGVTAPPTTWPELLSIIPRIAKRDGNSFSVAAIALGTTNNIENFSDIISLLFMQNGASLVTPTGQEAEETLAFYRRFATATDPVYTWNETMDNSMYAFATGKTAMILAPSWRAFDIKEMNPNLRFKIVPVPQIPGKTVTWASYWVEGVNAKSKNQQAAWEFLKFMTSRESAMKLYSEEAKIRLFGEPYARIDLGAQLTSDPFVGAYISQAKDAQSFPLASRTFDNGMNDQMIKYLENAVNALGQGSSPQSELETMSQGFKQVLTKYGAVSSSATTQ